MSNINPFGITEDSTVSVETKTQRIVVNPATSAVAIHNAGPMGPPGPPGSNGSAIAYDYVQSTPSSSWVINHNLGYHPNYSVEEAGTGTGLWPAEIHHSDDQMELQFNTPRAGVAHLS